MKLNNGEVHKYLGTKLDYPAVVQVKVTMLDYIDEIINTFDKAYPKGGITK